MGLELGGILQGAKNLVSREALSRVTGEAGGAIKGGLSREAKFAIGLGTLGYGLLSNPKKAIAEGLRPTIMNILSGLTYGATDAASAGESPEEAARAMASLNAPSPSPVAAQPSQISTPSSVRTPSGPVPIPGKTTSSFSQTPQSSAPAVSPQILAQIASGGAPAAPSAPVGTSTPFSAPAPATPSLARAYGDGGSPITGIQAAVLRRLAERGTRQAPAGYVGVPEAMPIGAAPRRRLREDNN